jgi:hypothetical protein
LRLHASENGPTNLKKLKSVVDGWDYCGADKFNKLQYLCSKVSENNK